MAAHPAEVPREALLGEYLDDCKQEVLSEIKRIIPRDGPHGDILYRLMLDYPLRPAKGLRPMLSIAACRGLGGNVAAIRGSAAVLELYHNAFLIHDDVEDQSVMRRGRSTLHLDHGVPIAVNVGDAMLSLSLRPLLDNMEVLGLGPAIRILQAVERMVRKSVEGQALELDWVKRGAWDVSDDDYIRMVEQKTGWYSFITPLTIGAIVAGAPIACIDALAEFGRRLGIAFQITDDLLGLRGEPEAFGKEIGGDLWEGKRSLILLHMVRSASPQERLEIEAILSLPQPIDPDIKNGTRVADLEEVLDDLLETGHLTSVGRQRLQRTLKRVGRPRCRTGHHVLYLYELIRKYDSCDYAASVAERWVRSARECFTDEVMQWLPPSSHRDALEALIDHVHQRRR